MASRTRKRRKAAFSIRLWRAQLRPMDGGSPPPSSADAQVVGDEDVGEPEVLLQVFEQVEDLRLHGHVERRDRLVADDQLRVDGEGARDTDSLALAAGELVREPVVVLRVETDDLEQL